jgi:large subunit ribosomal protein L30
MVKSAENSKKKTLCVKQIGSKIGCTKSQISSLRGLGLGKIGKTALVEDNRCVAGLIKTVAHLVKVEDSNGK